MTKKKNTRKYILIISALVLIIAGLTIGLSQAKYKTEKIIPGKVRFTATLAEGLKIQEHPATRQHDGSYTIDKSATPVQEQSYKLMPGVDIPKDPFITVTGKTAIPGWLFVEVVPGEGFPDTVKYNLTADWIDTGLLGDNNGKLYVYKKAITNADTQIEDDNGNVTALIPFYVLQEDNDHNTLTVSQYIKRNTEVALDFYAYLCQAVTDPAVGEGATAPDAQAIAAAAATDFCDDTCFGPHPTAPVTTNGTEQP